MKELYTALAGAVTRERQLAIVTNNLANVNSVGFKKERSLFEARPPEPALKAMARSADPELNLPTPRQWITGSQNQVRIAGTTTDFSTGNLRETGQTLDFALETRKPGSGGAFLAVQTPQGTRYTRAGNFALNEKQEVVTRHGDRVLAKGGQPLTLLDTSNVRVNGNGEVMANGGAMGALNLVYVEHPDWYAAFDLMPELIVETRRKLLQQIADHGWYAYASHFAAPCTGRITASGTTWQWTAQPL